MRTSLPDRRMLVRLPRFNPITTVSRSSRACSRGLIHSVALLIGSLLVIPLPGRAAVLAENLPPTPSLLGDPNIFAGQSFTVAGSGSYNNIKFNFFTNLAAPTPYAVGPGFLLSAPHFGLGVINSATPGFLGTATASGGFYSFDSSVTLVAGTQYFFYQIFEYIPANTLLIGGDYPGGAFFEALDDGLGFRLTSADILFRVTGDAVSVSTPDTGMTAAMLGVVVLGLAAVRRRLAS
jgi:hypothetical protein